MLQFTSRADEGSVAYRRDPKRYGSCCRRPTETRIAAWLGNNSRLIRFEERRDNRAVCSRCGSADSSNFDLDTRWESPCVRPLRPAEFPKIFKKFPKNSYFLPSGIRPNVCCDSSRNETQGPSTVREKPANCYPRGLDSLFIYYFSWQGKVGNSASSTHVCWNNLIRTMTSSKSFNVAFHLGNWQPFTVLL